MRKSTLRRAAIGATVVAVGVGGVASMGASAASPAKPAGAHTARITMETQGRDLIFEGPKKVEEGTKLKVVNKTNPAKVGPHTFTLIKKNRLPDSNRDGKRCVRIQLAVCVNIVKAHEADPETGRVDKPKVEVGRKGWDKSFGRTGDSWFTDAAGDHSTRRVSANPGRTLYFFCVVHPFMAGKIKVVE